MELLKQISEIGIVPVIKIDNPKDALPLARALIAGGLPVAEITFRTDAAKEAMAIISKECPEMLVGAGTVLTTNQVDDAIEAGAKFIVSPGLNPKIVKYCHEKNVLILPGCANASDIEAAIELGLDTVKFFPAEQLGGIKMIKALAAPYTKMKFMPTGGVSAQNLHDYLSFDRIVACGGTWMIDAQAMKDGDFAKIEQLTREAVQSMLNLKLEHVAINASGDQGSALADQFTRLFGIQKRETPKGFFSSDAIEILNAPYHYGTHGHLAIATPYPNRAKRVLESKGFTFDEASAQYNAQNELQFIYINEDFGGFRVHLIKK